MVARLETEAEDCKLPGKNKCKSDVAASTAPEGDGQGVQLFVPIRAAEAKKAVLGMSCPSSTDLRF